MNAIKSCTLFILPSILYDPEMHPVLRKQRCDCVSVSPAPSNQDESAKAKGKKTPPSAAKARKRRGFFERSGFTDSVPCRECWVFVAHAFVFPGWRSPAPSASSARSTARTWPPIWRASSTRTTSSFCPISCRSPPPTSCRCGRSAHKPTRTWVVLMAMFYVSYRNIWITSTIRRSSAWVRWTTTAPSSVRCSKSRIWREVRSLSVCVCVLTAEPLMMSLPVYRARHGALHEEGGGGSLLGVWRLHSHAVHADPEAPEVTGPQLQSQGTNGTSPRLWAAGGALVWPVFVQGMMEQSKRASLSVARSILNHKVIGKKLESFLKVRTWVFNGLWITFRQSYDCIL